MRFDLTVPFARYVALHRAELTFPFKRYHIGKVWRGENTQRGRYREFTQCDFDIIGSDSAAADFEIILLIHSVMKSLGVNVTIHINHRGLFNRFLSNIGQSENSVEILRAVDKLAKVGEEETLKSLTELAGDANAKKIVEFIGMKGSFSDVLERLTELAGGACAESERLSAIRQYMLDSTGGGAGTDPFVLSPSITRGLDYYTGIVYETFLNEMPDIGSICSGGRYDNLAALYSKEKDPISGVGSSIGLDRLLAALESMGKLPAANAPAAAIACVKAENSGRYQALAQKLRAAGINCEVFVDPCGEKNMVKQFVLAEKKGIRYVLLADEDASGNTVTLRDITERKNTEISVEEAIGILRR
jgi:histidyl-tRNA synthetase